jgi:hypothetical protein
VERPLYLPLPSPLPVLQPAPGSKTIPPLHDRTTVTGCSSEDAPHVSGWSRSASPR